MEAAAHPWPALGALLLRDGLVTEDDLDDVLAQQRDSNRNRISGKRLGEALVDRGIVTEEQIARLVAEQYELPYVEVHEDDVTVQVAALLPEDVAQRLGALPVSTLPDDSILVAVSDPANVLLSDELRRILARPLRFAVSTPVTIRAAIATAHRRLHDPAESPPSMTFTPEADGFVVPTAETGEPSRSLVDAVRDTSPRPPLGALLVRDGLVSEYELDAALAQQRLTASKRLGEILVEREVVTLAQVAQLVAEQHELPFLDLAEHGVDPDAAALLAEPTARRLGVVPVSFTTDGSLVVAVGDPTDAMYADDLRLALDVPLRFVVGDPDEIDASLDRVHRRDSSVPPEDVEVSPVGDPGEVMESVPAPLEIPSEAPDVAAPLHAVERRSLDTEEIEQVISRALALGSTDIHFTPRGDSVLVRVRLDGRLRELTTLDTTATDAVGALLRLAHVEVPEVSGPFEAQVMLERAGASTSLRLVVLPTLQGHRATLHVLGGVSQPTSLNELGLFEDQEAVIREALAGTPGLFVVCGPPGSGCSTTLYAALRELVAPERALATVEESIGSVLSDVDQIEVGAGLTYADGMRAVLLSDHDVVLVGDLPDAETARAAVRASVTGRFVLAGLRGQSFTGALERLDELELESAALGATLRVLVAQRLLRRVCGDCREPYYASPDELAELERPSEEAGMRLLARGGGCVACDGTGFRGHVAVFELLVVTDEIRSLLTRGPLPEEIEHAAHDAGIRTFRDAAILLCLEGLTTVSEVPGLQLRAGAPDVPTDPESFPPYLAGDGANAPA